MLPLKNPHLLQQQLFINGQWRDADDGRTLAVTNPADGQLLARVANAGEKETAVAISADAAAFTLWQVKTSKVRRQILRSVLFLLLDYPYDVDTLHTHIL